MPSNPLTILAFDTSAAHCAAVLLRGDKCVATRIEELGRGQVERLFPLLDAMMDAAGQRWDMLDAIAVCTGPGNFTGTRIGVSAARGLMMSLKIPAVGVTLFEAAAITAPNDITSVALPRDQFAVQEFAAGTPPTALSDPIITDVAPARISAFSIENVARYAALVLASGQPIARPAPLYLRPADAAPGKDKPPVMLDDT